MPNRLVLVAGSIVLASGVLIGGVAAAAEHPGRPTSPAPAATAPSGDRSEHAGHPSRSPGDHDGDQTGRDDDGMEHDDDATDAEDATDTDDATDDGGMHHDGTRHDGTRHDGEHRDG